MCSWQNYREVVGGILGFDLFSEYRKQEGNPIIDAIYCSDDYFSFTENFLNRLRKLDSFFRDSPSYSTFLDQVRLIADPRNYNGAYCELAAFDFFSSGDDWVTSDGMSLDHTVDDSRSSLGEFINGQASNWDIYFSQHDILCDIKTFSDTLKIKLDRAISKAKKNLGMEVSVLPALSTDRKHQDFSVRNLTKDLEDVLQSNIGQNINAKSTIFSGLSYSLKWGKGVNLAERSHNIYRYAENYHTLPFEHIRKFSTQSPCFLTFVVFPWFNNIPHQVLDSKRILYRSFSRRFFMQYRFSEQQFRDSDVSQYQGKFQGEHSVFDVTRHLSGILFLEDHSLNEDRFSGYLFLNPEAIHSMGRTSMFCIEYMRELGVYVDDFQYDNY